MPGIELGPRRRGLLLLGILGIVIVAVGLLFTWAYQERRSLRHSKAAVFHWIPGTAPLKILSAPPFASTPGTDVRSEMSPRLLALLEDAGIGGELRLVGVLSLERMDGAREGAILLQNKPQGPFTLGLMGCETVLYLEQATGFEVFPKKAAALGSSITLTPDKNAQVDLLHVSGPGGQWGPMGLWWW